MVSVTGWTNVVPTLPQGGVDNPHDRAVAENDALLCGVVGSSAHGLSVDEQDDLDLMGVCIESPQYVIGLSAFAQWTYRTKPMGVRSGPGDVDLTVFSLRKWARLAANGNPTILLLLYTPHYKATTEGEELREIKQSFASKRVVRAFYHYMGQQRKSLFGEKGGKHGKRPDLVDVYGYDTKYAGHVIRLGFQGLEFAETGGLTLPMSLEARLEILSIRRGERTLQYIRELATDLEARLEVQTTQCDLPPEPAKDRVNAWLANIYLRHWERTKTVRDV
jgi:predicted nucleotidyltransferase